MPPALMEVTLTEAQTYVKGNRTYTYGEPVMVTKAEADYLATHATKSGKIVSGGKTTRHEIQLFKFRIPDDTELDEDDDDVEEAPQGYVPDEEPDADILKDAEEVQTVDPRRETVEGAADAQAGKNTKPAADTAGQKDGAKRTRARKPAAKPTE